jgi:subtilisin family serine protease
MAALAAQPNVERVIPDRIVTGHRMLPVRIPNPRDNRSTLRAQPVLSKRNQGDGPIQAPPPPQDAFYTTTPQGWAVRQIGATGINIGGASAPGAWDRTTGAGVRIAILDSGVDANHPDIAPHLALNMSEVNQTDLPSVCEDGSPQDQTGHGTWAASLAAGVAGGGKVVGVAPDATILNIKVLQRMPGTGSTDAERCANGQASGMLSWVLQGIDDAVTQGANVISLSLGSMVDLYTGDGAGLKASFDRVTHAAADAGVVIVAALGNDGFDFSNSRYIELPAMARDVIPVIAVTNPACAEALTTGATCKAGAITVPYYSNRGTNVGAVAAPGGSYPSGGDDTISGWVRGACSSGKPATEDGLPADSAHSYGCFGLGHQEYVQAMGTSASAPLVAGVAALMRATHPGWTPAKIAEVLRSTGTTTTAVPYPQVNALAAINAE